MGCHPGVVREVGELRARADLLQARHRRGVPRRDQPDQRPDRLRPRLDRRPRRRHRAHVRRGVRALHGLQVHLLRRLRHVPRHVRRARGQAVDEPAAAHAGKARRSGPEAGPRRLRRPRPRRQHWWRAWRTSAPAAGRRRRTRFARIRPGGSRRGRVYGSGIHRRSSSRCRGWCRGRRRGRRRGCRCWCDCRADRDRGGRGCEGRQGRRGGGTEARWCDRPQRGRARVGGPGRSDSAAGGPAATSRPVAHGGSAAAGNCGSAGRATGRRRARSPASGDRAVAAAGPEAWRFAAHVPARITATAAARRDADAAGVTHLTTTSGAAPDGSGQAVTAPPATSRGGELARPEAAAPCRSAVAT